MTLIPEHRGMFASLSVRESLAISTGRRLADQAVVLGKGVVQRARPMAELQDQDDVTRTWLGV
jgi:ABC-type branched-subunit amino acid transport system ATPase component